MTNNNISNLIPIGIDYGNEIIKVKTATQELGMVNLIAPGRERRKLSVDRSHPINLLDVQIRSNGEDLGRWFVGGMAYKYSQNRAMNREEGGNKADFPYMAHSVLTIMAYSLFDPKELNKVVDIKLGIGLSAEEYWQYPTHQELVRKRLLGEHTIEFLNPAFEQAKIQLNIHEIIIMPESSAAALAYVTGEDPSISRSSLYEIVDAYNLIVDVGGFTTDVAVLAGGEFEDSFGFNSGIAEPLSLIAEALRRNYDIEVNRQQVGIALRRYNGVLLTRQGDKINIEAMGKVFFRDFTVHMVNRLLKVLRDNDIDKRQIHKAYFVGGGSYMIRDYLQTYVTDLDVEVIDDPLMANVRGYYVSVSGRYQQKKQGATTQDEDGVFRS